MGKIRNYITKFNRPLNGLLLTGLAGLSLIGCATNKVASYPTADSPFGQAITSGMYRIVSDKNEKGNLNMYAIHRGAYLDFQIIAGNQMNLINDTPVGEGKKIYHGKINYPNNLDGEIMKLCEEADKNRDKVISPKEALEIIKKY